jgi:hypothetical protein
MSLQWNSGGLRLLTPRSLPEVPEWGVVTHRESLLALRWCPVFGEPGPSSDPLLPHLAAKDLPLLMSPELGAHCRQQLVCEVRFAT